MKPNRLAKSHAQHDRIAWVALSVLLVLRIPYTVAIIYFLPIENQTGAAVYEVCTYILTAVLIWWERRNLHEFHMDAAALFCILLFRPAQTLVMNYWRVDSPVTFPYLPSLILWLVAMGLSIALLKSGSTPPPLSTRMLIWLSIGLIFGMVFSLAQNLTVILPALSFLNQRLTNPALLQSSALMLLYHLGFAPVSEEPLFRGFLWGYLRQRKWRETSICLFQSGLFTLAHVYRASQDPLLFWVFIPLSGLLFGWLTWRSRSIAPAILAHGLINGSAYLLIINLLPFLN
jgi:membrane protease YdiL (CAAX protease family)